jgi:hypothetical protein
MLSQICDNSVLFLFIGCNDVFYPDVWYIHQSPSFISILSNYNIYHTNLILLYHFDALSIDLKSTSRVINKWIKQIMITDLLVYNLLLHYLI